jgi:hypothetical protein
MSGILVMVTGSSVSRTAAITCKASFFAPCGIMVPDNFLPPVTSKLDMMYYKKVMQWNEPAIMKK